MGWEQSHCIAAKHCSLLQEHVWLRTFIWPQAKALITYKHKQKAYGLRREGRTAPDDKLCFEGIMRIAVQMADGQMAVAVTHGDVFIALLTGRLSVRVGCGCRK